MTDWHPRAWAIADGAAPPDPQVVAEIARCPTTLLADAGEGVRIASGGIRHVAGGREVCGAACTVWTRPGDLLFMVKITELVQPGQVVVVDGGGREDAAMMGEIFSAVLQRGGCAGAVVDGAVRDLAGIDAVGLPVFARHVYPAKGTLEGPGAINVPVTCGGATVEPGDIVRGDVNGVVVVPRGAAADVLASARAVRTAEERWMAEATDGRALTGILGLQETFGRREATRSRSSTRWTRTSS